MIPLLQVLTHTPAWVFALFLLLLAVGVRQLRERRVRPARLAVMPMAMGAVSLYGVVSSFGILPAPLVAWLAGVTLALAAVLRWPAPVPARYDSATCTIHLPGSAAPLALMMGIFFTKYAVSVALALHPALRDQASLTLPVCTLYGSFSGLLAGRALRIGQLLLRGPALPSQSAS